MKCCSKDLSNPSIVDGTAYFVCPECGDAIEVENYRIFTLDESINYFEEKYGLVLPSEYLELSSVSETKVISLPPCDTDSLKYFFGDGFYEIGQFASVNPNDDDSIYKKVEYGREWGISESFIPLEGDGHTWLALDYRCSSTNPKVIVVESEGGNYLIVANSFKEFVSKLLKYEDVYDSNGNVIFVKKST